MLTEEEKREREIRKRLDEVVGTDFDAPHARGFGEWLRSRWRKWAMGAAFAVAAMLLVFYTIESHRVPPVKPVPVNKPVPVQILPPR